MHRVDLSKDGTLSRWLALATALVAASACSGPPAEDAPATGVVQRGLYGVSFQVSLNRPTGGRIVSSDGRIDCGTTTTRCGPVSFAWNATATFTAIPDAGNMFGTWAGDCTCRGPCVLDTKASGSDKYILAVFGPQGVVQHCNFTKQSLHGPEYLDFLGRQPSSFTCNDRSCHGPTLGGAGIAPPCAGCHASAGWTSWQTNCSFCHGTSSAQTKAGYAFALHPEWAAPPHAVSQRLTGTAAPSRTGAHQAHLAGVSSGGLRVGNPIPCGTCHVVPTTLSHVGGSQSRATVVLNGAAIGLPASLGTYDAASGTCTTYCHGPGPSPAWSSTGLQCASCHGSPPPGHQTVGSTGACAGCHPLTVLADGTLALAGGKHLDGAVQVSMPADGACDACHAAVPAPSPHLSAPPILSDCARCHGAAEHPARGGPAVSDTACVACHTDK